MSEIKYFTAEGLQKLKDELDDLILRERPRIIQAIAEARDKGDLSENAEYDAAKEAQGLLEAKIADLQDLIFNARALILRIWRPLSLNVNRRPSPIRNTKAIPQK